MISGIIGIKHFSKALPNSSLSYPLHAQFNDPESRLAAGCLLPSNLADEYSLAKIPGVSATRAKTIDRFLKALSDKRKKPPETRFKAELEGLHGIGPKTAQTLVSKIAPISSTTLCNVIIRDHSTTTP